MDKDGYEAARAWLQERAPGWHIKYAETRLVAGPFVGADTILRCQVVLEPLNESYPVELVGQGASIYEACRNAMGDWQV